MHGILVQLPLPSHIDETAITEAVDPRKDVDGFHSHNSVNCAIFIMVTLLPPGETIQKKFSSAFCSVYSERRDGTA